MNAARLLEHFDRISDAADAVPRLRRFVLDLAVRGKLVDQDEADEPAPVLLGRIAAAKVSVTKKSKGHTSANAAQAGPFTVPNSWTFSCIADVGEISPRNEADADTTAAFIPMAMISQIFGVAPSHEVRRWGDIKKGYTHVARGDVAVAKITPCFENGKSTVFGDLENGIGAATTELHVVRPFLINPGYLLIFLKSPFFIDNGIPKMTGTAGQKRLPGDYFASAPLPVPPLAEQQRIVAKVDELMALCDRLQAAQVEREARRDRLVAASLARVSQPAADDAASDARAAGFHLDHFARLTTRPEHVKHLRQTILNLAVRGRLVPQDPKDEPAEHLLTSIVEQKNLLAGRKTIARRKLLDRPSNEEGGFVVPNGWEWCRLEHVILTAGDGPHFSPSYVERANGIPFLSTRNITADGFQLADLKYVSEADHREFSRKIQAKKGDLLYTKGGTTGVAIVNDLDFEFSVWVHVAILKIPTEQIYSRYIAVALNSPHCYEQSQRLTHGIGNRDLGLTRMVRITIPLPPLAEQRRIVAKVDELMALCDQLEASLAAAATDRARLLESLLHEALATAT
jgi:type I restriction enzyme S subunit